jgi:hypothetical protein
MLASALAVAIPGAAPSAEEVGGGPGHGHGLREPRGAGESSRLGSGLGEGRRTGVAAAAPGIESRFEIAAAEEIRRQGGVRVFEEQGRGERKIGVALGIDEAVRREVDASAANDSWLDGQGVGRSIATEREDLAVGDDEVAGSEPEDRLGGGHADLKKIADGGVRREGKGRVAGVRDLRGWGRRFSRPG